ncbi:MAG: Ig-like domain-containing protein [Acidobacteriaceae bacterium]|nr:Ig-like domain-containing protein [Acidobacteriaceae bacterium]
MVFLLAALVLASESKAQTQSKTLLSSSTALYARLVRISHSTNAALSGRIVASVTAFQGGTSEEDIYASSDGATFTLEGAIHDSDFNGGLCCGTLFELPQQVGSLPAGTLIWSGSIGQNSTTQAMQLKVYASQDGGVTWAYLSTLAVTTKVGTTGGGLWEPQFTVATDGALVAVFSDETVSGHSQLLRQMRSYDGVKWQDSTYTVATTTQSDRPGMAVINVLPSGVYFMSYEMCGPASCTAFYRTSTDGWNWGDSTNAGTRIVSTTGQYFEHAPTNAWAPSTVNPNGTILLTGQLLYESNGTLSSGNGSTIFVNHSADGSGSWTTMPAPIKVPNAYDNYCPNYSSPMLPSVDGQSVLEFASDYVGTTCVMYYGSGAITGGTTAATVTVTPAQNNVTSLPMNVTTTVAGTVAGANTQPTGTVTLSTGSWTSVATVLSSGSAIISLPAGSLASSSATLTVNYSGDANFAAAVGIDTLTVSSSVLPGLKVAATAVTVKAGASSGNTSTVTVTPLAGFTGTVNLAATISSSPANASTMPSLSFGSNSAVTISGTSAATATLTVTTQSASTAALHQNLGLNPWLQVSFASLFGFLTLFRARRRAIRNGIVLMLLACVIILPGCGGSGSTPSNPVTIPGTSTGDYVVTVTATSSATTATSTFNLTVN